MRSLKYFVLAIGIAAQIFLIGCSTHRNVAIQNVWGKSINRNRNCYKWLCGDFFHNYSIMKYLER